MGGNAEMTACFMARPATTPSLHADAPIQHLRAGAAVARSAFCDLRRRAVLEGCKWDPQVGDVDTLSPFPLVMRSNTWKQLASQAEHLTAEAIAAEEEISQHPELLNRLGLPRPLRNILAEKTPMSPAAVRAMRFDFHYTTEGWRISEANSDVPGGFSEASYFTTIMAEHFPCLQLAGNPADLWSMAVARSARPGAVVGLLSAPGYMEDHQVIAFLARRLRELGCRAYLTKPEQIRWRDGVAHLDSAWYRGSLDIIVRFYQAEWLARLPQQFGWKHFFRCGKTPVTSPPLAIISESKRFPVVWPNLSAKLPTWCALLPETRDPRDVPWARDDNWMLKTAMCNNGDTVCVREWMRRTDWLRTRLAVQLSPDNWVAQRRFESLPISTPDGLRHACVGVYTIDGLAAGAYARLSEKPLIDFAASDVALLVEADE
jgi:hypothetical protein